MGIMFDHEIEITIKTYVLAADMDGPDYPSDVLDALKSEVNGMKTGDDLNYEVISSEREEY